MDLPAKRPVFQREAGPTQTLNIHIFLPSGIAVIGLSGLLNSSTGLQAMKKPCKNKNIFTGIFHDGKILWRYFDFIVNHCDILRCLAGLYFFHQVLRLLA
jgi:hypothetical protein